MDKKIKLKLPPDMENCKNYKLPQVDMVSAKLRRTIVNTEGNVEEVEQEILLPNSKIGN